MNSRNGPHRGGERSKLNVKTWEVIMTTKSNHYLATNYTLMSMTKRGLGVSDKEFTDTQLGK